MTLHGLPGYPECQNDDDQVPRLQRFRAANPHITIKSPCKATCGEWEARHGKHLLAHNTLLEHLLDELEDGQ